MKFKKETKHTVVYESIAEGLEALQQPVESVYVQKAWLANGNLRDGAFPKLIELEVKVP